MALPSIRGAGSLKEERSRCRGREELAAGYDKEAVCQHLVLESLSTTLLCTVARRCSGRIKLTKIQEIFGVDYNHNNNEDGDDETSSGSVCTNSARSTCTSSNSSSSSSSSSNSSSDSWCRCRSCTFNQIY
ncbi:hypothetical protein GQX74_011430 [Glossina fuscipes]|nr:hypothetical protein GQX74_011430 [Glossina fuscipes]